MTRVPELSRDELDAEVEAAMDLQVEQLGYVPNSLLTMAHRPKTAAAFARLAGEVMIGGTLEKPLKQLVAYISSNAAGCRYCQAHTSKRSTEFGVQADKIQHAFEFETSDLFTDAEREALRLARDASLVPSDASDEHFERLRDHFSDDEIVEIVSVISLFGWLNRWNDTMATTLEPAASQFATENLGASGWEIGAHA
jgi:uncharacterized peroxidase-related enzyme